MKKITFLLLYLAAFPLWAAVNLGPVINKVSLTLEAKQWVTTKTAEVNVTVNAAVSDQDIGVIQGKVLDKLKQLSTQSEWHIVSFNRHQDQSGLESIVIVAQNRLPQSELAGLRDKAKTMSKAGETYTIANVQFIPSDEEIRAAMLNLRNDIYQQAKSEIDTLNKLYPEQNYYLYAINFGYAPVEPMPMAANMMMEKASVRQAAPLNVGNKMTLYANVIIASIPQVVIQGLHGN